MQASVHPADSAMCKTYPSRAVTTGRIPPPALSGPIMNDMNPVSPWKTKSANVSNGSPYFPEEVYSPVSESGDHQTTLSPSSVNSSIPEEQGSDFDLPEFLEFPSHNWDWEDIQELPDFPKDDSGSGRTASVQNLTDSNYHAAMPQSLLKSPDHRAHLAKESVGNNPATSARAGLLSAMLTSEASTTQHPAYRGTANFCPSPNPWDHIDTSRYSSGYVERDSFAMLTNTNPLQPHCPRMESCSRAPQNGLIDDNKNSELRNLLYSSDNQFRSTGNLDAQQRLGGQPQFSVADPAPSTCFLSDVLTDTRTTLSTDCCNGLSPDVSWIKQEVQQPSSCIFTDFQRQQLSPDISELSDDSTCVESIKTEPPTTETGRKRRSKLKYLQPEEKKERRKAQNRKAAERCRKRKKEKTEAIMMDYYRELGAHNELKEEVGKLRMQAQMLMKQLQEHQRSCPFVLNAQGQQLSL